VAVQLIGKNRRCVRVDVADLILDCRDYRWHLWSPTGCWTHASFWLTATRGDLQRLRAADVQPAAHDLPPEFVELVRRAAGKGLPKGKLIIVPE
jgi:hypothetical protein